MAEPDTKSQNLTDHKHFYNYLIDLQSKNPKDYGRHLFRGVRDAEKYKLVPTALRSDAEIWFKTFDAFAGKGKSAGIEYFEMGALSLFYRRATEMGLNLPRVQPETHRYLMNPELPEGVTIVGSPDLANDKLDELWAVAQHYGVKTRLLDWSRSSGAAMTFAARTALAHVHKMLANDGKSGSYKAKEYWSDPNNQIAVWVINRDGVERLNSLLDAQYQKNGYSQNGFPSRVTFVDPPTQSNQNIVAQLGSFTRFNPEIKNTKYLNLEKVNDPLDESIKKTLSFWSSKHVKLNWNKSEKPLLQKVTLPVSEIANLLRLLVQHNMVAAKLLPVFSGCAKMLDEYAMLQQVASKLEN